MTRPTPRRRTLGVATLGVLLALALGAGSLSGPAGAASASSGDADVQPETQSTLDPPPVVCPAAEGNARFVRFIYLNILYRCPDEAGLAYWTARLDAGYSRGQFAKFVDLSTENLVFNNVNALYDGLLGRDPSPAELQAGVAHIKANQSDARIIADILGSDEYYAAFEADPESPLSKDQQWLDQAYQFILDRGVDEGAAAYWATVMGSPSTQAGRQRVTRFLEHSPEATYGWIFGVYYAGLNRPPSEGDIAFWQGWLLGAGKWRTFHMWTTVLSSPEAYALAQSQPSPEALSSTPEGAVNKADVAG